MSTKSAFLPMAIIVSANILSATPANAQSADSTPPRSMINVHHQRIDSIMKDMTPSHRNKWA